MTLLHINSYKNNDGVFDCHLWMLCVDNHCYISAKNINIAVGLKKLFIVCRKICVQMYECNIPHIVFSHSPSSFRILTKNGTMKVAWCCIFYYWKYQFNILCLLLVGWLFVFNIDLYLSEIKSKSDLESPYSSCELSTESLNNFL